MKKQKMNKQLIAIVFATLMIVSAFAMLVTATPTAVSTGNGNPVIPDTTITTQPYVIVNITNSQGTATPIDFSQMLKVNWSLYSSDLNANVSNVRFYTAYPFTSSHELSGWIETNNTTTA